MIIFLQATRKSSNLKNEAQRSIFFSPLSSEIFSTYMRMKRFLRQDERKYIFQLCTLNNKFQCFYVSLKSLCRNIRGKLKKTTRKRKTFPFFVFHYFIFILLLLCFLCMFRVYLPREHNSGSKKCLSQGKKKKEASTRDSCVFIVRNRVKCL